MTKSSSRSRKLVPSFRRGFLPANSVSQRLNDLTLPHISSYNSFLDDGINDIVSNLSFQELVLPTGENLRFWINSARIGVPVIVEERKERTLLPRECRERSLSYAAPLTVVLSRSINDQASKELSFQLGTVPIMIRSSHCHLHNLSPGELVAACEEAVEFGGYFISNGNERLIRMLQIPKRNYVMAITRNAYMNRGAMYSNKGVLIRSVANDQSSVTITLHYLLDGSATVRFAVKRQEFFIPIIILLKALVSTTDREIFEKVVGSDYSNTYLSDRMLVLLRESKTLGDSIVSQDSALAFLGARFRAILDLPASIKDNEAGQILLDRYLLIHIDNRATTDKFELLLMMLRKLYSFVKGEILEDNPDSLANQEILLPGHLMQMYLKEKLDDFLSGIRRFIQKEFSGTVLTSALQNNEIKSSNRKLVIPSTDAQWDQYFQRVVSRQPDVGKALHFLITTGNLRTTTGLDLMQVSGFTVVADKINFMRFTTHFRSVHRGAFFTTMKTTTVRKLLPENWGFLCPVHTPDGGPCGLLNHVANYCSVIGKPIKAETVSEIRLSITKFLVSQGMTLSSELLAPSNHIPILFDGIIIGSATMELAEEFSKMLKRLKASASNVRIERAFDPSLECDDLIMPLLRQAVHAEPSGLEKVQENENMLASAVTSTIPIGLEIALVGAGTQKLKSQNQSSTNSKRLYPFACLVISTTPARMVRPVVQIDTGLIELISPLEQPFLNIASSEEDLLAASASPTERHYSHVEVNMTAMLSEVAQLTPFSDLNQSPRNMYQAQMGKQTMGNPIHSWPRRADNKMFRLQHGQAPLVQNAAQADYGMDEYPNGCNAVVAVIAYTGFDMEDAFILNKSSYERGFGHASVYKTLVIDLQEGQSPDQRDRVIFHNAVKADGLATSGMYSDVAFQNLDADGLPVPGTLVKQGEPLYITYHRDTKKHSIVRHKEAEPVHIDEVRILPSNINPENRGIQHVSIKLRYNRNPVVGDKFSSRHGQKGVLSYLWPQIDMPFTDEGVVPDVLINPHAFPSRMTIGMLVESLAGKSGSLHGQFQDSTPFRFDEKNRVVDYFGEQLASAGYSYHGTETMYSGVTGEPLHTHIYIGVVYYQRLRHMINDKSQVRALGPVNNITKQPVKGRKKHGGIRLGEMERDSLLAHGTAFMLHDRLMNSSDRHIALVCKGCKSLISPYSTKSMSTELNTLDASKSSVANVTTLGAGLSQRATRRQPTCSFCNTGEHITIVAVPYVFRYLINELAGMNVRLQLDVGL
jgi:DNA-directed RNA polymerase I subunit RPA2